MRTCNVERMIRLQARGIRDLSRRTPSYQAKGRIPKNPILGVSVRPKFQNFCPEKI